LDRREGFLLDAVIKLILIKPPQELRERTLRFVLDQQWQIPGNSGAWCHTQKKHGDIQFPRIQNRIQPELEPFWMMVAKQFLQFVGVHVDEGSVSVRDIMPLRRNHFARLWVFLGFHQFGYERFRDSESVQVNQDPGFVVKPNDDDIHWADMDYPHEGGVDAIGCQAAIPVGTGTMAILILPHDLGSQGNIQ
jgi:hypothetical protein